MDQVYGPKLLCLTERFSLGVEEMKLLKIACDITTILLASFFVSVALVIAMAFGSREVFMGVSALLCLVGGICTMERLESGRDFFFEPWLRRHRKSGFFILLPVWILACGLMMVCLVAGIEAYTGQPYAGAAEITRLW